MSSPLHDVLETFDDTKLQALAELMLIAASADGELSEEERQQFIDSIELLTEKRLSAAVLDPLFERIECDLDASGWGERLRTVKERLGDVGACRAALTLVIEMMAADGILRTSERELIPVIAGALGIDSDSAADEVSAISRNGRV